MDTAPANFTSNLEQFYIQFFQ